MKRIWKNIVTYFTSINYDILSKSCLEVFWLTLITLVPLITNIAIAAMEANDLIEPLKTKILPGEMISYGLGFLAPTLYLLTRTQGSDYKLPWLHGFSIFSLILYGCTLVFYLIVKNKWVKKIDLEPHGFDLYFKVSMTIFLLTIAFRIYSIYHGRNLSSYMSRRAQQQVDFNVQFANSINLQK